MNKKITFFKKSKLLFSFLAVTFATHLPAQVSALELSLTPFGEPTYLGLNLGMSTIDIGSERFSEQGLDVDLNLDDSSTLASLFFVVPVNKDMGLELSISQMGNFMFSGDISGNLNVGTIEGEQTYRGVGINAYYQKIFNNFATRAHLGMVQTIIKTEGNIDLVGKSAQSINDTENSTNLFFSLETNKTIYKDWSLGPAISILNTADRIQIFSLKLSKELSK
jgi:hypothetical protein